MLALGSSQALTIPSLNSLLYLLRFLATGVAAKYIHAHGLSPHLFLSGDQIKAYRIA